MLAYPNRASVIGLVLAVKKISCSAYYNRSLSKVRSSDRRRHRLGNAPSRGNHDVFLGLYRRYRACEGLERFKLTDAKKRAF